MRVDVAIVGAGPVGLSLARALAGEGLSVALIDRQPLAALRSPAPDGREIALSQPSRAILERLGLWARLPEDAVSPLREARVFNGSSPFALNLAAPNVSAGQPLGVMVPNHAIRQAAFDEAWACDGIRWCESALTRIDTDAHAARLWLEDGTAIEAALAVAADSRFSETRRQMGIATEMRDNGRSMLVCRMTHERTHDQSAWEWFDHGQTLALLPLTAHCSSVVLTLRSRDMDALVAMPPAAFSANIAARFAHRLGAMHKQGEAYVYPLVSTYAERFVSRRFALVGDAAVGMHPVTAHGFNFGVQGMQRLADRILAAHRSGRDIADPLALSRYEREHRLATRPLYLATQAIVSLYTDDRLPARLLRHAGLRLAERAYPFKTAIAHTLARH
ncbi:5-demethoxyubiquinol-8 5-hydroxylase UbiM [Litchfieldella xinjiangensis]|uniref:5-demethoxyubiquinol-8 5-hydroxylase UbiM n=1 Tax=Litchfieldella xinjiangensis TaxID=1166948 RepID=UPI0005BD5B18|nr:5-demethoxyubiquinol-8 5-hydroxylase UbiM [Halomonas xinjiangensis]